MLQLEACAHPFFDELRDPETRLPNGRELPPLFNFTPQGKYVYPFLACGFKSYHISFLPSCRAIQCVSRIDPSPHPGACTEMSKRLAA